MRSAAVRIGVRAAMLSAALMLAACQVELFSNLTEGDANQMLAVLVASGIQTDKSATGKEGFTLKVDERDLLRAIAVLKDHGYPRSTRESIGKVFQKSGIMSSPFEERVRYNYALGEDVAQTISAIDGVITARVHIVLPEAPQLGQPVKPSSAAVFIKHQPGVDLDFLVPQIRRLVSNSVEGLDFASVAVVLTEARPTQSAPPKEGNGMVEIMPGVEVPEGQKQRLWIIMAGVGALVALLALANVATYLSLRPKRAKKGGEPATNPLVEPS